MKNLEHILNAIANFNGALTSPASEAYQLKNPLLVKSFSTPGAHKVDEHGRRVFDTFWAGYRACLFDLECKISGNSRLQLKPTDPITRIFEVYGFTKSTEQSALLKFLRRALNNDSINEETPLSFFHED